MLFGRGKIHERLYRLQYRVCLLAGFLIRGFSQLIYLVGSAASVNSSIWSPSSSSSAIHRSRIAVSILSSPSCLKRSLNSPRGITLVSRPASNERAQIAASYVPSAPGRLNAPSLSAPPALGAWADGGDGAMYPELSTMPSLPAPPALGAWADGGDGEIYPELFNTMPSLPAPPALGAWADGGNGEMYPELSNTMPSLPAPPALGAWADGGNGEMYSELSNTMPSLPVSPALSAWADGGNGEMYPELSMMPTAHYRYPLPWARGRTADGGDGAENILWNAELKRALIIDFHRCRLDHQLIHKRTRPLKRSLCGTEERESKRERMVCLLPDPEEP